MAHRDFMVTTPAGSPAAVVTITGLGTDEAPEVVEEIEGVLVEALAPRVKSR